MKMADALRAVKPYVFSGGGAVPRNMSRYICLAAALACIDQAITSRARDRLHNMIMRRLKYSMSVSTWLRDNVFKTEEGHKKIFGKMSAAQIDKQIQLYRHRWIDALIAEYDAKGT